VARPTYDFGTQSSLQYVLHEVKKNLKHYPWHLVIDALRPHTQMLWLSWGKKERSQFLRHLRMKWDLHLHRIPPEHYETLMKLIQSGQIVIKKADASSLLNNSFIDCRGFKIESSFLHKLVEKNLIQIDQFKLGIEEKIDWVKAVGPLNRGKFWENTAVAEIKEETRSTAKIILTALKQAP
jgi:uncharacterized NAD(P)/FAD-binding protein YdhS